jgi:hypothetical protein
MYKIGQSSLGGRGLFASRSLSRGTTVLLDRPVNMSMYLKTQLDLGKTTAESEQLFQDQYNSLELLSVLQICVRRGLQGDDPLDIFNSSRTFFEPRKQQFKNFMDQICDPKEVLVLTRMSETFKIHVDTLCQHYFYIAMNNFDRRISLEEDGGKVQTFTGNAMYPILQLVNHSCQPNCDLLSTVSGSKLVANSRIKRGQELTYQYAKNFEEKFLTPCLCSSCKDDDGKDNVLCNNSPDQKSIELLLKLQSIHTTRQRCEVCQADDGLSRCGTCKIPFYCSKRCQRFDWKNGHKASCFASTKNVKKSRPTRKI